MLSSVTLSWHGHVASFYLTHSLQCHVCSGLQGHTFLLPCFSPSSGCSFLMGCVWGRISFIPRCAGCCLSNLIWCDLCQVPGPTFHNKFLLNSLAFRLVSHLPRRLLTDNPENCFPVTGRVMWDPSLDVLPAPGDRSERWLPSIAGCLG